MFSHTDRTGGAGLGLVTSGPGGRPQPPVRLLCRLSCQLSPETRSAGRGALLSHLPPSVARWLAGGTAGPTVPPGAVWTRTAPSKP